MCLVWQIWAIRITYMIYKRTGKRNNFCILIFMVVMVKVIILSKFRKWGPFSLFIKDSRTPFVSQKQSLFTWVLIYYYILIFIELTKESFPLLEQ